MKSKRLSRVYAVWLARARAAKITVDRAFVGGLLALGLAASLFIASIPRPLIFREPAWFALASAVLILSVSGVLGLNKHFTNRGTK